MNNFVFQNPTKIYFGKGSISNLVAELSKVGPRVLLTYGGGSIKKNGIYNAAISSLAKANKTVYELSGIMPNPRKEKVYQGIDICKTNNVDFILAVGGGSVIDCSKFIAAGAKTDRDFWQSFLVNQEDCYDAIPLASILTLAGTGSEMDAGGVISDFENNLKLHYGHPLLFPKFSILDPEYTYSLPKEQLVYGSIDAISHILEVYFSKPDESNLSDDLAEAILKNLITNLDVALKNHDDYIARSNLMWCSTLAINGLISLGKEGDWMSHEIEHALSAFYDIPHGAGLAIVHPNYLMHVYKSAIPKFAKFASNIFGISSSTLDEEGRARAGIIALSNYFKQIGAPTTLGEVNIPSSEIQKIAKTVNLFNTSYARKFSLKDIESILVKSINHLEN
ncbi:MAG: iron-containing alcohol dehydrogenase [Christensenellaceae bacterium]|jgi:alcohol dehydrogenase YqhD (iron-dependent ADH family)|nr:iron-containing alcohol dehydrogenase [Christensenellaceae bacterium]